MNHSERSSVPKQSKASYRTARDNGREPRKRDNVHESTMTLKCHHYKSPEHKMKCCKQLTKKSDTLSNVENDKSKC